MGKHFVKLYVQRVLEGREADDIHADAMNSLPDHRVSSVDEEGSCIDMVDSTGWKHNGVRLKRGLTRKQKTKTVRASESTPKTKKKSAKTGTTKVFNVEEPFDLKEFENCLNENSGVTEDRLKKEMKVIRAGSYWITRRRTNLTGTEINMTIPTQNKKTYRHSSPAESSIDKDPKHKKEPIGTKAPKPERVAYRDSSDNYYGSSEYYTHESKSHYGMSTEEDDWNRKSLLAQDDHQEGDKVAKKKHRQKRAAKKGGKKGKGGGRDKSAFDFGFGKKKGYQNKGNQGNKGKGGGGGGGWGGGGKKKGKGGGGGGKNKNKGSDSDNSGSDIVIDFGKMFGMGGDDDDSDYDEEYDIDSEEELSHRGGGRGGRTNYKGNKNNKNNQNQNKQQHKQQNQHKGDGIVREKLTIMEIKDEDDSIYRRRNVHVVSNKKGGNTHTQQKRQHYQEKQRQEEVYVRKESIKYLVYLNDTKIQYGNDTYFGIKLKNKARRSNRSTIHRRVKRSAKKAKKAKAKNTKRTHKGGSKQKSKKEKKKTRANKYKKNNEASDMYSDIIREKLTITELKSGEDEKDNGTSKQATKMKKPDKDNDVSADNKETVKTIDDEGTDESPSTESQSDVGDEKVPKTESSEDMSRSHLSVPDHLIANSDTSKKEKTDKKYDEINKALRIDVAKLKEKYQVDSEELRDEVRKANKYFEEEKKKEVLEKEKKTKDKNTGKKKGSKKKRRGPPTKHTTKKRREPKKVFDYSAEWGAKDKELKDGIKTIIQDLNGKLFKTLKDKQIIQDENLTL